RGAGILQSSMPTAVLASIIAIEYDLLPEFVTEVVLFSTLASLVTLTLVMVIV
ncbi:MAG: AEC family transporter, partial [Spirochaetota bacterium]